ncbi:hypothetical protein BH09BAC6_BH09BAC6_33070 [soil metagenome]|jgi:putative hydrolase of the HAD superfamily
MKRALILDLDNTIYPVSSIADNLFEQLFTLLDQHSGDINYDDLLKAKDEMTRRPYHLVADKYNFSAALKNKGTSLLQNITYDAPMQTYDEYSFIRDLPIDRFLVTTGFTKLQQSKVKMLGIEGDLKEFHIVDPETSSLTKRDVFADIIKRHHYKTQDVLVVGDDPESEIKAAIDLGIDTFLFDPDDKHSDAVVTYKARNLKEIVDFLAGEKLKGES